MDDLWAIRRSNEADLRWILVAMFYVAATVQGGLHVLTRHSGLHLLLAMYIASTVSLWTTADAGRRGRSIVHIVQNIILFSWPVAVPVYLVWSRGWRGVGWTLLNAVGLAMANAAGFYAAIIWAFGFDALVRTP